MVAGAVSIIVPVHNDHAALARLLRLLKTDGGIDAPHEVIVVDASDAQQTAALCQTMGARYLSSAQGRGVQLNAGAAAANNPIVWFLHADAMPPADGLAHVSRAIGAGAVGGWFRFRFAGASSKGQQNLAALINLRAERGVAYGDQGLFFTQRFFSQAGGFEALPLFEEVSLVKRAKATGQFAACDATIGVDPRRWQRSGWVRRTIYNRLLAFGFRLGIGADTLARWYRR
ncbi:MAG: TIGR04283 family arsenosugar biosynthesis glycosyltransferase [Pseudomonadota bacterium]